MIIYVINLRTVFIKIILDLDNQLKEHFLRKSLFIHLIKNNKK